MGTRNLSRFVKDLAGRLFIPPLAAVAVRLKWSSASRLGNALGDLAYTFSRRYRKQAVENLIMAYGAEWTPDRIRSIARQVFKNFTRAGIEFFAIQKMSDEELRRVMPLRGMEHLDAAIAKGNGTIFLTGHLGNWELLARRLVMEGYKLNVIARDSDDPAMTGLFNSVRGSGGYVVLPRRNAVGPALRCLRRNEVLGILPDQNTLGPCVFAEFFGCLAATAMGPAMFSIRTGAPVVPGFAPRMPDGSYEGVIYPAMELQPTGDRDTDVAALVQAYTMVIEQEVRKYPDQWLWLHGRWRRRPTPAQERSSELMLSQYNV